MKDSAKTWLAAYCYYSEPWEKFLTQAIKPLVQEVLQEEMADQFFFIRYWERGPHIRLRFKGDPEILEKELKPKLQLYFDQYFEKYPSDRDDPDWLKTLSEDQQWYPNNSVQFIPYEPETDRYGGEECLIIAEEQFEASSKAILEILDESDEWDYNRALGAAIQLHLGFAYSLDMDISEAYGFFERFFHNWLPRAYNSYRNDIDAEEIEKRKKETLLAFKENFENQKETLTPFFKVLWDAFHNQQEFEQAWLNEWVSDMKAVKEKLHSAQKEDYLNPPQWYKINEQSASPLKHQERWSIYDSYVHMINNRLGVLNRDEGYLAYLIKEGLKSLE